MAGKISKKRKYNSIELVSTAKTLVLDVNENLFDLNSMTLAFVANYNAYKTQIVDGKEVKILDEKGKPIPVYYNKLIFNREVVRENKQKMAVMTVIGDVEYGVPTLYDKKVLQALERLFIKQHMKDGVMTYKTAEEVTKEDRILNYGSITNIARELKYEGSINSRVRENIKIAIQRLSNATWKSAIGWDVHDNDKSYNYVLSKGYRLFEPIDVELEKNRINKDGSKTLIDYSTVLVLSEELYRSLANNKVIIYNEIIDSKITHLPAQNMYLIAKTWAGDDNSIKISLDKLIDVVPTIQKGKRRLEYGKNAIKKIEESGICKIKYLNNNVILFTFDKEADKRRIDNFTNKYISWPDTVERLIEIGFTQEEILLLDTSKSDKIQAILRFMDNINYARIHNKKTPITFPKKYFLKCYNNDSIEIDEKYYI